MRIKDSETINAIQQAPLAKQANKVVESLNPPEPPEVGMPAPFTEEDSHGNQAILSPGQKVVVMLKDNPSTGHRWADRIHANDNYFELLNTEYIPSGNGFGAGGNRVYTFRVKEDMLKWHKTESQVPATLSIYKLAPGESYEERSTRGDGSGAEFSLNTLILNQEGCRPWELR